jgi:hypothetical protein
LSLTERQESYRSPPEAPVQSRNLECVNGKCRKETLCRPDELLRNKITKG